MWDSCGLLKGMGTHAVVISSGTVGKTNRALALSLPDLRPEPDTPPSWVAVGVFILSVRSLWSCLYGAENELCAVLDTESCTQ